MLCGSMHQKLSPGKGPWRWVQYTERNMQQRLQQANWTDEMRTDYKRKHEMEK